MYKEGLEPVYKTCDESVSTDIPPPLASELGQSTLMHVGELVHHYFEWKDL